MNTPNYPNINGLCESINNASFTVKMRGYAPEEVDAFMDDIVEHLEKMAESLEELKRYDTWLRVEVQAQVVARAQQEAQKILQEAQNQARAVTESARAEAERERTEQTRRAQEYNASWNLQKETLDRELAALKKTVQDYRAQQSRALTEALNAIQQEQPVTYPPATIPATIPTPTYQPTDPKMDSLDDIEALLAQVKKQVC